jgi:hypothetical protein
VWQEFGYDLTGDGWDDNVIINSAGNGKAFWYENPKNKAGLWKGRMILSTAGIEAPAFVDVDGDGKKDIICNDITTTSHMV